MRVLRVLQSKRDKLPHDCRCGHTPGAHEHYRRGTDCALCTCPKFRAGSTVSKPEEPRSAFRERVRAA